MANQRVALTEQQLAELPTHENLQFLNETNENRRQRYLAKLYELKDRDIAVPYSLDWNIATDTGLVEGMNPFLTYTYHEDGVPRFTCSAWRSLFSMQDPIYRELTLEFFSTVRFDATQLDCTNECFSFRLGGNMYTISTRELAWRLGLYTRTQTRSALFVRFINSLLTHKPEDFSEADFWMEIAGVVYAPSSAKERMIRSPIFRLLHRLIASTVYHKHGSDKVPATDLFYLWALVTPGRHLNLPYAAAVFLARLGGGLGRSRSAITGGQFVTRLAESYSLTDQDSVRGMMGYHIRPLSGPQLEAMTILERAEDGTYRIPNMVQPAGDAPQQQPPQQPRRRRMRSPRQQQVPEPEIDIRYLSNQMAGFQVQMDRHMDRHREQMTGLQVQSQWMGSNMAQFFEQQGYHPQYPFPSLYPPFPSWFEPPPPQDEAGPSGTRDDDDDE